MTTKRCIKCKKTKPLSEFYKNKHCKDGYLNDCKICQKKITKKYQSTIKGKEVHRKGTKKFSFLNPKMIKAEMAVTHAIRADKLSHAKTLQCYYCPKSAQQYHHWHGYEREYWLDVIPVCTECHQKYRRKIA